MFESDFESMAPGFEWRLDPASGTWHLWSPAHEDVSRLLDTLPATAPASPVEPPRPMPY